MALVFLFCTFSLVDIIDLYDSKRRKKNFLSLLMSDPLIFSLTLGKVDHYASMWRLWMPSMMLIITSKGPKEENGRTTSNAVTLEG